VRKIGFAFNEVFLSVGVVIPTKTITPLDLSCSHYFLSAI